MVGEGLPSFELRADYGAIGLTLGTSLPTFNVTGELGVPIFEGGRQQGKLAEADADLRERRAEAEDMKAEVYYDVRIGVSRSADQPRSSSQPRPAPGNWPRCN